MTPTVMAIGGGKGGTGKSFLAVQMGIALAQQGLRVLLVDADPNGANLHTFFGLEDPSHDIDVLLDQDISTRTVILPTGIEHLGLIAGTRQEMRLRTEPDFLHDAVQKLRWEEVDLVLWDVGSGTSMWSTFLFEQADIGCWVVQTEPTCIEKEYHFLRHVCRWRLASILEPEEAPPADWLPIPWLTSIKHDDPARAKLLHQQLRRRPFLLLGNQIHQPDEREIPEEMMAACHRFFGIEGHALGWLPFDERVWLSVRLRRPIVLEYPEARWVKQFDSIIQRLIPFLKPSR